MAAKAATKQEIMFVWEGKDKKGECDTFS